MTLPDIQQTVDILKLELYNGWLYFQIAKEIQFKYFDAHTTNAIYFFTGTYQACIEYSTLIFAKIADSQDKISFNRLLTEARINPDGFRPVAQENVLATIAQHEKRLFELHPIIKEVKHWRNNVIAHLTMDFIRSPSEMSKHPPLNLIRLEEGYRAFFDMINTYSRYLGVDTVPLDHLSTSVKEDLDFLIGLMRKADETN